MPSQHNKLSTFRKDQNLDHLDLDENYTPPVLGDDFDDDESGGLHNDSAHMSPRVVKTTRFEEPSSSGSSNGCGSPLSKKNQETSMMMQKPKKRPVPAVFARLWNQNKKRDEKLKLQRESSRE
jgi:hypothetical protein